MTHPIKKYQTQNVVLAPLDHGAGVNIRSSANAQTSVKPSNGAMTSANAQTSVKPSNGAMTSADTQTSVKPSNGAMTSANAQTSVKPSNGAMTSADAQTSVKHSNGELTSANAQTSVIPSNGVMTSVVTQTSLKNNNRALSDSRSAVKPFEKSYFPRKDVIEAFQKYYDGKTDFFRPFTLTMIWGFSTNGYGCYRTNKYLQPENQHYIQTVLEQIKNRKTEQAFDTLQKIKGLNISYISKILYFAGCAAKIERYPLIFDIRVARNLVALWDPAIMQILNITPSNKYKDYDTYNNLLHDWAKEMEVSADAIELFLFEGAFLRETDTTDKD